MRYGGTRQSGRDRACGRGQNDLTVNRCEYHTTILLVPYCMVPRHDDNMEVVWSAIVMAYVMAPLIISLSFTPEQPRMTVRRANRQFTTNIM